jgi:hypothetical protein
LSAKSRPIVSRISETVKGFWIKCQSGAIVIASGAYPDIKTTFISGRALDNRAAISVPFILRAIARKIDADLARHPMASSRTRFGLVPAENTSHDSPLSWRKSPSAIWLMAEFLVQKIRPVS